MFTTINNLSNYPINSIVVKVVKDRNSESSNGGYETFLASNDFLFLKLQMNGLKKFQRFSDVSLILTANDIPLDEKINLYYIGRNTGTYFDAVGFTENLNEDSSNLFTNLTEIFERDDKKIIKIKLERFFKNQDTEYRDALIAINFPNAINGITIDNPIATATWSASVYDTCGIIPIHKYDEHNFGNGGNLKVNLFSGQYTYILPLLQSTSTKMPISFSLYQGDYRDDSVEHLKNKLIPNFYYKFYFINTDIIIENPSGLRMCYTNINRDEEAYKQYNIKHTEEVGDLYYCSFDRTYFYYNKEEGIFKLYDKNDNLITIDAGIDFSNAKIMEIESKTGEKLTYHWSGTQLLKIINSENEEMRVEYTSDGYIKKVYMDSIFQYVEFTDSTNGDNQIVNIKTYNSKDTTNNVVINDVSLSFTNGFLSKIYNNITSQYLNVWFNETTRKVTGVGIYSKDVQVINFKNYLYTDDYTRISYPNDKYVYCYFDLFGRVISVMNDNNRTITYNYQQIEGGNSSELISVSKVQTNNRNLLDNASFESENIYNEYNSSWLGVDSRDSDVSIEYSGLLSERCLKIHLQDKDSVTIYQNIVLNKTGTYKFRGFIKHPEPNSLTNDNLIISVNGSYDVSELVPVFENSIETGVTIKLVTKQIQKNATLDFTKTNWYEFEIDDITIPLNAVNINLKVEVSVLEKGNIVYLDDFQFTNGLINKRHNYIENGYMESVDSNNLPCGWYLENLESNDKVVEYSDELHAELFENKIMKITKSSLGKEKRIYNVISTLGFGGEKFVYTVFGKLKGAKKESCKAYIKFYYETLKDLEDYDDSLYFIDSFEDWQSVTGEITTKDNYYAIEVGVICKDVKEVLLDCFQLYKESFGINYKYDSQGNLTETSDGDSYSKVIYDENNRVVATISKDGNCHKYTYDENELLIKTEDMFGNTIEYEYDDKKRLLNKKITSEDEVISMHTLKDYTKNTDIHINQFEDVSITNLDYLKRVSSQVDPLSIVTNYIYNNKLQLDSVQSAVDGKTLRNNFVYNNDGTLSKVIELNGVEYEMTYDSFERITKIACGPLTVEQYEYNSNVAPANAQVTKKTLSNSIGCYEFEYNKEGQVSSVKLNGYLLAVYEYDDNGNLYKLKDEQNNITHYYSFDSKGNLLKEFSSDGNILSYEYNHLGNLNKVVYKGEETSRSVSYEYPEVAITNSKEHFIHRLVDEYKDDILVDGKFLFGGTCNKSKFDSLVDDETGVKMMRFSNPAHLLELNLKLLNSRRNKYDVDFNYDEWKKKLDFNKTIYMFVKPSSLEQLFTPTNILLFGRYLSNEIYIDALSYLKVTENGKLTYCSSNGSILFTSNTSLKSNEWNLVGITFSSVDSNTDTKIKVFLNDEISEEINVNENVKDIEMISFYDQHGVPLQDKLELNVGLISTGTYQFDYKKINGLYGLFKRFYKHNIEQYMSTTYYDSNAYKGFDVITLHGSFQSEEGLKPYLLLSAEESYKYDKYKLFEYDSVLKRCVFSSYAENSLVKDGKTDLVYSLPVSTEATLSLRFKYISRDTEKYLFSFSNDITNCLGVYISHENKFILKTSDSFYDLGEITNDWNHLVLRTSVEKNRTQLYLNGVLVFNLSISFNLSFNLFALGNEFNARYPLNGCIEMFAYSPKYATDEEVTRLFTKGVPVSIRKLCDQLGRIKENQICTDNNAITTIYQYDKTRVSSETLPDGTNISYTYDRRGNILSKTYTKIGQAIQTEIYTYDELGRLKSDMDVSGKLTEYTYDSNGNILIVKETINGQVVSDKRYNYQEIVLTEVYDAVTSETIEEITYDGDLLYPYRILGVDEEPLYWVGNQLVEIYNKGRYTYNHYGIRIRKETSFETTSFSLERSNIIGMNKVVDDESYRLDFTYDANNQLVGLTTSEGNYFYIKDITNNIIGLIDSNGNYVVKYTYNVWGKLLSKDILIPCIAAQHNPFMYKGYYYDEETGWYWLSSRYYSPELCRFISPVDVSSLNPHSINGLNLYSYSNNNPIGIAYSSSSVSGTASAGMVNSIGNAYSPNGNSIPGSTGSITLPAVSWLVENSTTIYGAFSSLVEGIPILSFYWKCKKTINQEFKLYGISKWKTSLQLSNVNFKMGALDVALIGVNVLIDMYDSYQRGVSTEGILLGGTLTAASGALMFYTNKGIMWLTTTIGTAICPGLGTAIGFGVGLIGSILLDMWLGNEIADWIDNNIK